MDLFFSCPEEYTVGRDNEAHQDESSSVLGLLAEGGEGGAGEGRVVEFAAGGVSFFGRCVVLAVVMC